VAQQDARAEKAEKTVAQGAAGVQRSDSTRPADSIAASAKTMIAPVTSVPPSLQQQANAVLGGGRGGRVQPRNELAFSGLAASNDLTNSCWQVDSVGTRQDAETRELAPRNPQFLRFTQPVVTDMAAGPLVRRAEPPVTVSAEQARARITSVAFRRQDSTYIGEMVVPDGRIEFEFTMHGDTLRGTMRRTGVTVRYAPEPWLAVRARCPR
jgi:hypothetical protein